MLGEIWVLLCAFIRSEKKSEPTNIFVFGGEGETSLKDEFDWSLIGRFRFLIGTSLNRIVSYMAHYIRYCSVNHGNIFSHRLSKLSTLGLYTYIIM